MDDDLDDLLDEIESGFLAVKNHSMLEAKIEREKNASFFFFFSPSTCSGGSVGKVSKVSSGTDELDRVLRDICSGSEMGGEEVSLGQFSLTRRRHSCREEKRVQSPSDARPSSDTSTKRQTQKSVFINT